jgi:hypothetical protein
MFTIYLSGPDEKYCAEKYKTLIKKLIKSAFPDVRIYDTEERPEGDWFENDLMTLENADMMVFMTPDFPLPGVAPKIGYFYANLYHRKLIKWGKPSDRIICIWPEKIEPKYGQRVIKRMGTIVPTAADAIELIGNYINLECTGKKCLCTQECDCANPDGEGVRHRSNECPVHNTYPAPNPECPIHGEGE